MALQHTIDWAMGQLRRAASGPALLAALLLSLLLIQPTLCIIHCAASAGYPSPGHDGHDGDNSHLLCSLSADPAPQEGHILVLAFWPSLPAILDVTLAQIALLLALPHLRTAPLLSLVWSPPIPPPRMIAPSR